MSKRLRVSLLILCLLGSVTRAWKPDLFPGRVSLAGNEIFDLLVVDLDKDGHLDVVTANYDSAHVTVLFGRGDGTLEPELRLRATGINHTGVAAADLNGDGNLDIVTAGGIPRYWLGLGKREFSSEVAVETPSHGFCGDVIAMDFTGDGVVDLVVNDFRIYLNEGNGDATFEPLIPLNDSPAEGFLVAGDFNADGLVDLAAADSCFGTGVVHAWLAMGYGEFGPGFELPLQGHNGRLYDFDKDGRLDLATVLGENVYVLLGTHNGHFVGQPDVYSGTIDGRFLTVADVDDDKDMDIVVSGYGTNRQGPYAYVLRANGDGTFESSGAIQYPLPIDGGPIDAGDFDEDGRVDFAIASIFGGPGPATPGKAVAQPTSVVYVARGDGAGGIVNERLPRIPTGDGPEDMVSGDFDVDGVPDLATANARSNDVTVLLGVGDGTFVAGASPGAGAKPVSLATGHFDAGPTLDLAVANSESSDVSLLLGKGDGSFAPAITVPLGRAPQRILSADLDGDGIDDLVTTNPDTNDVTILRGLGDATFSAPQHVVVGDTPDTAVVFEVEGDVRLAVTNVTSDEISLISFENGVGAAAVGTIPAGTNSPRRLAAGFVDEDPCEDLVVPGNQDPGSTVVLPGDCNGGFGAPILLDLPTAARSVQIADLDGDGRQDVVAAHGATLFVFRGSEKGFAPREAYAGLGWRSVPVADFNGDGLLDLASVGGAAAILLNQTRPHIRFAEDKQTLRWPRFVGYEGYHVYRGDLADLVDRNSDGLADAGYGACRDDLDADLTDALFTDAESPLPGRGFFYLMSRIKNGQEVEMGSSSSGLPRRPGAPCTPASGLWAIPGTPPPL